MADTPATLLAHAERRNEYRKNSSSSERANDAASHDAAMVSVAGRCRMLLRCATHRWLILEVMCLFPAKPLGLCCMQAAAQERAMITDNLAICILGLRSVIS